MNQNQQSGLDSILALATKSIVDTRGTDLNQALSVLRGWKKQDRLFGDLEWTRLTPWRETLATAFEDQLANPTSFNRIEIQYAGASVPASAYYLAAWLQLGVAAKPSFVPFSDPTAESGLVQVSIKSPELEIALSRMGPLCLRLKVGEQEQRVSLGGSSLYELMHEELSVLGQDPVYDAAFDRLGEIRS